MRADHYKKSELVEKLKTTLVSKNITVAKRRTSVRLEPEMWTALCEIAKREGCEVHDVCTLISVRKNAKTSLTSAIRVFVMLYFRAAATEEGHRRVAHGDIMRMLERARLSARDVVRDFVRKPEISPAAYEEVLQGSMA